MSLREAREYIGKVCQIRWADLTGEMHQMQSNIYDAFIVPMYGTYLVTDSGEILVDKIQSLSVVCEQQTDPADASWMDIDRIIA